MRSRRRTPTRSARTARGRSAWLAVLAAGVLACSAPPVTGGPGSAKATPGTPGSTPVATSSAGSAPAGTTVGTVGTAGPAGTAPQPRPVAWRTCGAIECASLDVPLDYADPGGPTVTLELARRRARKADQRIGSVLVNPGGPGAAGIDLIRSGGGVDRRISDVFDVVSWDPRGVGRSEAITCEDTIAPYRELDWSPDDAAEQLALDTSAAQIAEACARAAGPLLAHVHTDAVARDLDQIRAALGDDSLTYIGFSYGTFIGLRYAEMFPERVRAIVLDGVVDPTNDLGELLAGQVDALEILIDEVFGSCRDGECPLDDPAAAYDRIAAQVEEAPLPAGVTELGPTALAFAAIMSSYDGDLAPVFLGGLADAAQGDGTALRRLADTYWSSAAYASYLAVLCTDNPHPIGGAAFLELAEDLRRRSPRFGPAAANEVLACAYWSAPAVIEPGRVHARGAAPILVVGNTGDVATPFESARRVADDLERGMLLTYHGEGHTSYGKDPCVNGIVDDYLVELAAPAPGTECGPRPR